MRKIITTDSLKFLAFLGAAQGTYWSFLMADLELDQDKSAGVFEEVIIVSSYLAEQLAPDEFRAICLHEEGHFINDHYERTMALLADQIDSCVGEVAGIQIMNTPAFELEADAFSASIVGADTMAQALRHTVEIMYGQPALIEKGMKKKNLSRETVTEMLQQHKDLVLDSVKYRIDALTAL